MENPIFVEDERNKRHERKIRRDSGDPNEAEPEGELVEDFTSERLKETRVLRSDELLPGSPEWREYIERIRNERGYSDRPKKERKF